ncbi:hypothetical protein DM826_03620 [Halonotius aquaticus]|uniref:histidine kinase n=1 Tax=Halonotius aquaticus TaxID=2216978 RepID=A0A3A6Q0U4_9EURY|nr:PAS domain S-box protein [Halonotius aquaticus]RJX44175.1 hypothetical protein DM826_03620 [Halonotius aquaticus]
MTPTDGQQQATIGVVVSGSQADPVPTELCDGYALIDCDDSVPAVVDLCLVDAETIQTQPALVADWRAQQSPVFAPIVLLADPASQTDQGVDTEAPVRYDDVIETSTPTAALTRRIDNLFQRRRLSQELADTKQLTGSIFESSPLAKLIVGADGTIERANTRAGELFDISPTELVGQSYNADGWITLDDGTKLSVENGVPFADVIDTADPISEHECTITRPHDDDVVASVNAVPIQTDDAAVERVLLTLTDITARRAHANARDRQVDLFTKAQDIANVGAWEYDLRTADLYWTDEVYQIYGLSTDVTITSERAIAAYHPADRPAIEDAFERAVADGDAYDLELRLIDDTDTVRWVRTRGEPQSDDGDVIRVRGTIQDITERKTREGELQQMRNAVDKAPIGIVVSDPTQDDNPLVYVNNGFVEQTGYTRQEATGQNCRFLQGEDTDEETVAELRAAIDAAEPASATIRNYRADGSPFWNHLEIVPVTDESGTVANYIGFQQDVTERKERQEALKETQQRLALVLSETHTGVWTFHPESETITPIEFPDGLGLAEHASDVDAYLEQIHPADRDVVKDRIGSAIDSHEEFDVEFRLDTDEYERWLRSHGTVVTDSDGSDRVVGITTEITERVHRMTALEKRERLLRELHTATRHHYPLESQQALAEFVIAFLETALDLTYASMKLFDDDAGVLRSVCDSAAFGERPGSLATVAPGDNPVWEAYRSGESHRVNTPQFDGVATELPVTFTQLVAVPVGDFGVVVVYLPEATEFTNVDTDIVEVVATNAEAVLRGFESAESQAQLADQLSIQRAHIDTLQAVVDTTQAIQDRISQADTQSALDTAVCAELATPAPIEFVWIGRPRATETALTVTASAGGGEQYLDTVRSAHGACSLPAHIAATERELFSSNAISQHVRDTDWAKEALSYGYSAVLSIPLVHNDVLYGVLTAYSSHDDAFDEMYTNLLTDAASLLLNHTRVLDQRSLGSNQTPTTVTFKLADGSCPLQRLAAATASEIRLKTIVRATDDTVTVVAEIIDGDRQAVCEYASTATGINSATPFGTDDSTQILLELPRPFLATAVEQYGGQLLTATATPASTRIQLRITSGVSRRPLFEFITTQFEHAELIAQEERPDAAMDDRAALDELTERQREILNAAYYGGYYEIPRTVTGEELAASFDISSPAVYKHLQAAHKKLLKQLLTHEYPPHEGGLDS